MPDPLMTSAALRPYRNALRQRLDELDLPAELRSGAIGDAYAYFLLFENWPDLIEAKPLGAEALFYNRYYWFVRFTALWQAAHGHDAGAEQQAFQLLERAPFEVDWELVRDIDARARQGIAPVS